jgi:cation/acetate symporter
VAITVFLAFVMFVLGLSFYLGSRTKTSSGYYAAGGQIHWGVNGIAFAGDYLSAASFLGICGMIATVGYDGFLYSIGYLAGWIVALFVVAEPMKRLGKYTFTDALDANFDSKGIKLAAAISTLIVSIFYLIPQMVGAGVLVEPLLGIAHHWGVIMVGAIVITIVTTAGMASTTYVQFFKGGGWDVVAVQEVGHGASAHSFAQLSRDNVKTWWLVEQEAEGFVLRETQSVVAGTDGSHVINGTPASEDNQLRQVSNIVLLRGNDVVQRGSVSPFGFLAAMADPKTVVRRWKNAGFTDVAGAAVTVYYPALTTGNKIMRPGLKFKVEGTLLEKLDFVSLMLALFLGTAALPHILIRYYTVPDAASARKSTIVAIAAIGFFYILSLYMGLGAMISTVINPADNNMSAPLLARSFGEFLFAVISAIAFATILGTVSGLIVAASGAVAHDLADRYLNRHMSDATKIRAGKIAAVCVGAMAIVLGIVFKGVNVSFLVGLAFAVAASANLPSIIMILFWKGTTSKGITASIATGIVSSLGLIMLSPTMYKLYGMDPTTAIVPFSNPGIISIPLSFIVLVVVSLLTSSSKIEPEEAASEVA